MRNKTSTNLILKIMSNTLERLIDLRNFIINNPKSASGTWHVKTSCDKQAGEILKKHKIVANKGSNRRPFWEWLAGTPNYKTAERVDQLRKVKYAPKEKTDVEIKSNKMEFAEVLYGMKIDLNDNISFQIQRNAARIYRRDNGVAADFDNVNVFNKVLSLLK